MSEAIRSDKSSYITANDLPNTDIRPNANKAWMESHERNAVTLSEVQKRMYNQEQ